MMDGSLKLLLLFVTGLLQLLEGTVDSSDVTANNKWLAIHQYNCIQQRTVSKSQILHDYYQCILSVTSSCLSDTNNYKQDMIRMFDYCGFINGDKIKNALTEWIIITVLHIRLQFLHFSLYHAAGLCKPEKLIIQSVNKTDVFCGKRFPWSYDILSSTVKLTFHCAEVKLNRHYFKLYYEQIPVAVRTDYEIEIEPLIPTGMRTFHSEMIDTESYHFVAAFILHVVCVELINVCAAKYLSCYDGPGNRSPLLPYDPPGQTLLSTTYQMTCVMQRTMPKCNGPTRIVYADGGEADFRELIPDIPWYMSFVDGVQLYTYHRVGSREDDLIEKFSLRGMRPYMLHEGLTCMYGGVYMYAIGDDGVNIPEMWSYCNQFDFLVEDLALPSHPFLFVLVYYREYTVGEHSVSGSFIEIGDSKTADVTDLISANQLKTFEMQVSSSDIVILQPFLFIRLGTQITTYKVNFVSREGKSVSVLSLYADKEDEHCMACSFEYAPLRGKMITSVHKEPCEPQRRRQMPVDSPVRSVTISNHCKQSTNAWTFYILSWDPSSVEITPNKNISYVWHFPTLKDIDRRGAYDLSIFKMQVSVKQGNQADWWAEFQLVYQNNSFYECIWELSINDNKLCYLYDLYLEHISNDRCMSTVNEWQDYRRSKWIAGCGEHNLVLHGHSTKQYGCETNMVWKFLPKFYLANMFYNSATKHKILDKKQKIKLHRLRYCIASFFPCHLKDSKFMMQ